MSKLEVYPLPLFRFHWRDRDGKPDSIAVCAPDFWKACSVFRVKAPRDLEHLSVQRDMATVYVRVGDDGTEPIELEEK